MARSKSRAARASDQAGDWRGIVEELYGIEVAENATDEQKAQAVKDAQAILDKFDSGELESLAEEMGNWRDNIQGTALENTEQFSRVEEAASTLENIETEVPSIEDVDDIQQAADDLESRADELESVDFPGMFGR